MLGVEDLSELCSAIEGRLKGDGLLNLLVRLDANGDLRQFLELSGMADLSQDTRGYSPMKSGKIIVLGKSEVQQKHLEGIAGSLGISKNRLEFYLDYSDAKTRFDFNKIQYEPKYSLVLLGPMPHSTSGSGDYSSAIARLEGEEGFPPAIRCGGARLSISKSSFRDALEKALRGRVIIAA